MANFGGLRSNAANLSKWLKDCEHLIHWIQCLAVIAALIFSSIEIKHASDALEVSAAANEIALRSRISDLVIKINEVSLDHPEIDTGYTPAQRIQLMRIEYFFQVFNMKTGGIIDDERFRAEFEYLKWSWDQKEFRGTWVKVRNEYPKKFGNWVDTASK